MDRNLARGRRLLLLASEAALAMRLSREIGLAGIDVQATTDCTEFVNMVQTWRPTHVAVGIGVPGAPDGAELTVSVVPRGDVEEVVHRLLRTGAWDGPVADGSSLEELDEALDVGRLSVAFQPKIDTNDGSVVALEALARWTRPGIANVPPEDFVTLAEVTGRIGRLTETIFDLALTWFAQHFADSEVLLCVNLSGRSLADRRVPEHIETICRAAGLEPTRLVLEVTETYAIADQTIAHDVLVDLRERGVRVALDDFGSANASLLRLSRHPFSELKIDRQIVASVASNRESQAIIRAIVGLGDTLGLTIIAEGVEDHATYDRLRGLGCVVMQGNFFAPPMTPPALLEWLERR